MKGIHLTRLDIAESDQHHLSYLSLILALEGIAWVSVEVSPSLFHHELPVVNPWSYIHCSIHVFMLNLGVAMFVYAFLVLWQWLYFQQCPFIMHQGSYILLGFTYF